MTIAAFDAKEFNRGAEKSFFAPIGISVKIDDEGEFQERYDKIMEETAANFNFERTRYVYKSSQLLDELGLNKGIAFMEQFFSEIVDFIASTELYFTIIPPSKVSEIEIYGTGETVPTQKFLRKLNTNYVHCCGWKYSQVHDELPERLVLDYFEGKQTGAWHDLKEIDGLQIYLRGDLCNRLISTADLLISIVDFRLYRRKERLNEDNLRKIFLQENLTTTVEFIGQPDFGNIVMKRRKMIDTSPFLAHPIIFVLPETQFGSKARKIIENSPVMDSILNRAVELDGSTKFYDQDLDAGLVEDGDILIYMGDEGKELAEVISSVYDVEKSLAKDFRE